MVRVSNTACIGGSQFMAACDATTMPMATQSARVPRRIRRLKAES